MQGTLSTLARVLTINNLTTSNAGACWSEQNSISLTAINHVGLVRDPGSLGLRICS